jgi:surface protein
MFYECSALKELNLSNFNTNNVTNINHMFNKCSSLKEFNCANFNAKKIININEIFRGCSGELKKKIKKILKI